MFNTTYSEKAYRDLNRNHSPHVRTKIEHTIKIFSVKPPVIFSKYRYSHTCTLHVFNTAYTAKTYRDLNRNHSPHDRTKIEHTIKIFCVKTPVIYSKFCFLHTCTLHVFNTTYTAKTYRGLNRNHSTHIRTKFQKNIKILTVETTLIYSTYRYSHTCT